jgi:hypothetical protein
LLTFVSRSLPRVAENGGHLLLEFMQVEAILNVGLHALSLLAECGQPSFSFHGGSTAEQVAFVFGVIKDGESVLHCGTSDLV